MTDDRRQGRSTTATTDDDNDRRRQQPTTNDGDDRRLRKKSRPLILPKILNFRKIASFSKTGKIWFFSQVRPCDERGKWGTTDERDDRRRRRPTTTTTDDDYDWRRTTATTDDSEKISSTHFTKVLNFRTIASFWKTAKIRFFSQVRPCDERGKLRTTDHGDDGDNRPRRKNLANSFCQKSWILERLRVFEKRRKFDFFNRSVPVTKEGNDGRPTAKKSRPLILLTILDFRIASFWAKTDKGPSRRKTDMTNDGRTDDDRRRRKNFAHSFCQKS